MRCAPTHKEESASTVLQKHVRRQRAVARSAGRRNGDAAPSRTTYELCLLLNNVSWAMERLDDICGVMRSRLPALQRLPDAALRSSVADDETSVVAVGESTCAELCVFVARKVVYVHLLPHLAHAVEGELSGLLTKLNEAARAIAQGARPPWRLPLLMAALGTLAHVLHARLSTPDSFAALVSAVTVVVLPQHEVALLRESFRGEGLELDVAVVSALEDDLSAQDHRFTASVERAAAADERDASAERAVEVGP
jgi:hypothetical protein